jgi:(p)ppGpp synthase/HD superfamily hydrolase
MATLEKAILIAVEAHQGQTDKAGEPYILHPLRVMFRVSSETEKIAGVLHDIVEDSAWTIADLRKEGFSEGVLAVVECLTRREKEGYEEFIGRVQLNPAARSVKIADLEDNMDIMRIREPSGKDWERMKKYHQAWRRLRGEIMG